MTSGWDVGDTRWRYYNVVMCWMSKDSNGQLAYGMDRIC